MDVDESFNLVSYPNPLVHGKIRLPIKIRCKVNKKYVVLAQLLKRNIFLFADGTIARSNEEAAVYISKVLNVCPKQSSRASWSILINIDMEDIWFNMKDLNFGNVFEEEEVGKPGLTQFLYHDATNTINTSEFVFEKPECHAMFDARFLPSDIREDLEIEESSKNPNDPSSSMEPTSKRKKAGEKEDEEADMFEELLPSYDDWDIESSKAEDWCETKLFGLFYNNKDDLPRMTGIKKVYTSEFANPKFLCVFVHPKTMDPVEIWINATLLSVVPEYTNFMERAMEEFEN